MVLYVVMIMIMGFHNLIILIIIIIMIIIDTDRVLIQKIHNIGYRWDLSNGHFLKLVSFLSVSSIQRHWEWGWCRQRGWSECETPAAAVVQSMMPRSKRKMQISLDSPIHSLVVIQKWYVYTHIHNYTCFLNVWHDNISHFCSGNLRWHHVERVVVIVKN